jgi:hypothetical protein
MARIYPDFQEFIDLRDVTGIGRQEVLGVTRITVVTTSSDHFDLPRTTEDAQILQADRSTADPTFYLSAGGNTRFNIDGGTVGTQYLVVSKHAGFINYGEFSAG